MEGSSGRQKEIFAIVIESASQGGMHLQRIHVLVGTGEVAEGRGWRGGREGGWGACARFLQGGPSGRGPGYGRLGFECFTVGPILLWLMEIWQTRLGKCERWGNT